MSRATAASLLAILATGLGCAKALHEPPSLAEMAGGARHAREDVDRLLAEAEAAFDRRELPDVAKAAGIWLQAAAADPTRVEGLLGATEAQVWITERDPYDDRRLAAATAAVHSAQWCERIAPENPHCRYWLALALGVQARERKSTAVDAVKKMIRLLQAVIDEAPEIEHGGPHMALALIYLKAPGWPLGPGDPDLALEHALIAVEIEGDYPPNQQTLGEALEEVDDPDGAREAYGRSLELARRWLERGELDARDWIEQADKRLAAVDD